MAFNLFSAITSGMNAYNALSNTQTGQNMIGQAKQAIAPVIQPIQQAFQPAYETAKSAVAPIGNAVGSIAKPIVQNAVFQKKTADYYAPFKSEIEKIGITYDDLAELPEEEKQQVVSQLKQIGVTIPGLMEAEQAMQKQQVVQPIEESMADKFKMQSSEEFGVVENIKDLGKFFVNLPADSAQVVGGLYDAVTNPIDTVTGILKVGQGISDKAVFSIANSISSALGGKTAGPTQDAQMVDSIATHIKDTYGTAGKFKKAIVENPADTLLTLMGGLGIASKVAEANNMTNVVNNINKIQQVINPVNVLKQEAKLITAPLKYTAKEVLPSILGKTTGTSAETIKTAFKQGGTPEFQSALRGQTTPQDILSNVQKGMQSIKDNRKIAYGEDYAKLQANKTPLAIDDVVQNFVKSLQDEYKIGVGKKGLDFSQSKITGTTSQSQIENMYRDLVGWKDKTPEGLDVLKQRLQDYYRGTPDSSKGDRLSTIASNAVKSKIVENVPEYANMTATYEKITNDIRDITKTLSLGDKTQAQTAITKLNSVLRENFPARQDMIKLIEQYTGKNIQGQIAGSSLSPLLSKGLAGTYAGGGFIFGQAMNPAFWSGLALASPRLIGEIANTIGVPIEKFKTAINNIKKYGNTNANTSNATGGNMERVKIVTPVKKPIVKPKQRDLLQEKYDIDNAKTKPIIIENRKVEPKGVPKKVTTETMTTTKDIHGTYDINGIPVNVSYNPAFGYTVKNIKTGDEIRSFSTEKELRSWMQNIPKISNKTTNAKQQGIKLKSSDTVPEGYFKNSFGEIQKNPSNKKGGFIKIPEVGKTKNSYSPEGAIRTYTNSSDKINKMLREGKEHPQIEALDKFLTETKKYDGTVYRGLTVDESKYNSILENVRKNGIKDKAYISTTENYGDATTYSRNSKIDGKKGIMFEIESKNGRVIDRKYNAYNEEEILFARNTEFEYAGEYNDAGRGLIIKLKEKPTSQGIPKKTPEIGKKEMSPLIEEARKYKSSEDYLKKDTITYLEFQKELGKEKDILESWHNKKVYKNINIKISDIAPTWQQKTAILDIKQGDKSFTKRPVTLVYRNGQIEIKDGRHRTAEAIMKGDKIINANIIDMSGDLPKNFNKYNTQ